MHPLLKKGIFYILLILCIPAFAQDGGRTISGYITARDEAGPLEGVTVAVKGSKMVSGSQADGSYYIPVTVKDSVLIFSYDGYQTYELKLKKDNHYDVALKKLEKVGN